MRGAVLGHGARPTASTIWSICGLLSSRLVGSFHSVDSRGLESVSRPLVPNTATPSLSALRVERCTSSSALLLALELQLVGDVLEHIDHAALGAGGRRDHLHGAAIGQMPGLALARRLAACRTGRCLARHAW